MFNDEIDERRKMEGKILEYEVKHRHKPETFYRRIQSTNRLPLRKQI